MRTVETPGAPKAPGARLAAEAAPDEHADGYYEAVVEDREGKRLEFVA